MFSNHFQCTHPAQFGLTVHIALHVLWELKPAIHRQFGDQRVKDKQLLIAPSRRNETQQWSKVSNTSRIWMYKFSITSWYGLNIPNSALISRTIATLFFSSHGHMRLPTQRRLHRSCIQLCLVITGYCPSETNIRHLKGGDPDPYPFPVGKSTWLSCDEIYKITTWVGNPLPGCWLVANEGLGWDPRA